MAIRAGTSGFAYKTWKDNFYPEDVADARMLAYYASQLPAVEINNTFYRMPSAKLIDKWSADVPDEFCFVLKATRRITHFAKLAEVDELLEYLMRTTAPLGDRLGAHLFQLPPYLRCDHELLASFLSSLPEGQRAAVEFRHESWFDSVVYEVLRDHDAALVIADGGKVEVPFEATASWGYLRLRRDDYTDGDLEDWAARVRQQGWDDTFVFFKHEDDGAGPRMAAQFLELTG